MLTKLTLHIDDQLIEQVKSYAEHTGKSVSQIVGDYFKLLTTAKMKSVSPATPVTQSLRGVLKESKIDKKDYKKYLNEKHQ